MRKLIVVLAVLGAAVLAAPQASASRFKVFGAAAYVSPLGDSDISGVPDAVEASDELGWSAGFEWRFADRLGLEGDVTWSDADLESGGSVLGSAEFQPIAVNLNFHFFPDKIFDLYVGGGFAYVNVGDVDFQGTDVDVDSESTFDVQVGFDINLGDHFAIVLGVRYYDLTVDGSGGEELEVNPLVSRVGAGWRW
jgi:outer membrane protein